MSNLKKREQDEYGRYTPVRPEAVQTETTQSGSQGQPTQSLTDGYMDYGALANEALKNYRNSKYNYDLFADPIYKQAQEAAMRQGQLAAKNTAAQAATLTGGYGNSYGTMAAQQQYNAALQQVNDMVPELEANAYNRYLAQQQKDMTLTQMYLDLENQKYNREYNKAALGAQYGDYSGLRGLGINTDTYESKERADRDWELLNRERQQTEWTQADEARALQLALQKAQYKDYSALEALGYDMSTQKQQDLMDMALEWAKMGDYRLLQQLNIDTSLLEAQKAADMAQAQYQTAQYAGYGGYGGSGSSTGRTGTSRSESTSRTESANSESQDASEYKTNYWNLRGDQTEYLKDALKKNGYKFTEVKYWTDTESGPAFVAKDAKGTQYSIQVNEKTGEIEEPKKRK